MIVYRYNHNDDSPYSGADFAMWVNNAVASEHYGDVCWKLDASDLPHIDDYIEKISAALKEDFENGDLSCGMEDVLQYAIDEHGDDAFDVFANEFAPSDIVGSAQAWDNGDAMSWFWNRFADPEDLKGVRTPDGAITFYADMGERA